MKRIIPYIKVCGVQDPEIAHNAAVAGAAYIGMIFYAESKRNVSVEAAVKIAGAAKAGGAQPVAVFVEQTAEAMLEVCNATGITMVQLHGEVARSQHQYLPKYIKRIYVLHVDDNGKVVNSDDQAIELLNASRDCFLFDGMVGGSGKIIKTDNIKQCTKDFNFFIAGGLNQGNVNAVINQCAPYGVDVNSGVEDSHCNKSLVQISEFIVAVNGEANYHAQ